MAKASRNFENRTFTMNNNDGSEVQPSRHPNVTPIKRQTRRVNVFLWKQTMGDGQTVRIMQRLDFPLPFANHPEFTNALNDARLNLYGDDGVLYQTKETQFPSDENTVIHMISIISDSGMVVNKKALTPSEAEEQLKKIRATTESNQQVFYQKQLYKEMLLNGKQNQNLGTNLGQAIQTAQEIVPEEKVENE